MSCQIRSSYVITDLISRKETIAHEHSASKSVMLFVVSDKALCIVIIIHDTPRQFFSRSILETATACLNQDHPKTVDETSWK